MDAGNQTSTAVSGSINGATYSVAVTACNSDRLESDPSNEVSLGMPGILRLTANASPNYPVQVDLPVEPGRTYILLASEYLEPRANLWETVSVTNDVIGFTNTNSIVFSKDFTDCSAIAEVMATAKISNPKVRARRRRIFPTQK